MIKKMYIQSSVCELISGVKSVEGKNILQVHVVKRVWERCQTRSREIVLGHQGESIDLRNICLGFNLHPDLI